MEYGYVRVSTKEQNEDRQMVAMREFGIKEGNIILDKQSGQNFERPGYRRLVRSSKIIVFYRSVMWLKALKTLGFLISSFCIVQ